MSGGFASGPETGAPQTTSQTTPLTQAILFARGRHAFCIGVESLVQVVRRVTVNPAPGPGGLAGFIVLDNGFVPAVDPGAALDGTEPVLEGHALLVDTGNGTVALLADKVQGLRRLERVAPAPWLGPGAIAGQAVVVEGAGHAYLVRPEDLRRLPLGGTTRKEAPPSPEADESGELHLCFTVGPDRFAAPFSAVDRILHDKKAWPLPGATAPVRTVVESNGAVVPVFELEPGPPCLFGTFVVLLADGGSVAVAVDSIDRPQRLRRDVGDNGWFDGPGGGELAEGRSLAFRILTGPALLGPRKEG